MNTTKSQREVNVVIGWAQYVKTSIDLANMLQVAVDTSVKS